MFNDLRLALRQLLKHPGFTAVAAVTLALGIAANTAIFSVLNALIFRPLPFCDSERILRFAAESEDPGSGRVSYTAYLAFRGLTNIFTEVAAVSDFEESVVMAVANRRERVRASLVTANYFQALEAPPQLGRGFLPEENVTRNGHPVVILSHRLWQRFFGADPNVIGRSMSLNSRFFTVIGVAPKGFRGDSLGGDPDLWAPIMMMEQIQLSLARAELDVLTDRGQEWLRVLGVLREDVTQKQADAAVKVLNRQIQREAVISILNANRVRLESDQVNLDSFPIMTVRPLASANRNRSFLKIGGFVQALGVGLLLVACANIANFLLVRGLDRRSEIALRMALGAKRGRLMRQLLSESMLLALLAGGLGTCMSLWLVKLCGHWVDALGASHGFQLAASFSVDMRVLVFALLISGLTGVIFGLVPAWRATGTNLADMIKDPQALTLMPDRRLGLRELLTAGQIAVTLVLIFVGAGFIRSSIHLLKIDFGFESDRLLAAQFDFEADGVALADRRGFVDRVLERVRQLPGIESATFTQVLPGLDERHPGTSVSTSDRTDRMYNAVDSAVELDFFRTVGIPLLAGRGFQPSDETGPPVVVISEALAGELWPGQSAVGKPLLIDRRIGSVLRRNILAKGTWVTVVGVAREVGFTIGNQRSAKNQLYRPAVQKMPAQMYLLVRTKADPIAARSSLGSAIRSFDERCGLVDPKPFRDFLGPFPTIYRYVTLGFLIIGVVGLFLAALGLYATVSYSASCRFKEFGIRLALGATRNSLARLVVNRGLLVAGLGMTIGLISAQWVTRLTSKFVFGIQPVDLAAVVTVCGGITVVLLITTLIPAIRAAKADPMIALRHE